MDDGFWRACEGAQALGVDEDEKGVLEEREKVSAAITIIMIVIIEVIFIYYVFIYNKYMFFIIKIKEPAEKKLRKYNKEIQRRFAIKIRKLREHPDLHGKPLRGVLHGFWELYFENKFRILYTIDYKEQTVTIEAIKHKDEF